MNRTKLTKNVFKESDHPRADDGKFGKGGGEDSSRDSEGQPTKLGSVKTVSDLRRINGGIGSAYDHESFYDEAVIPLHNQNTSKPLRSFARKNPEQFAKLRMASMFEAWKDSRSKGTFGNFMQKGKVEVFRGVLPGATREGASWTMSRQVAEAFSKHGARLGLKGRGVQSGKVISKTLKLDDALYYSNKQGEKEFLLRVPVSNRQSQFIFNDDGNAVGVKTSVGYSVVWPDLDSNTDKDKAQIASTKTQALAAYVSGNVESVMPLMEFYTKVLGMTDEEAGPLVEAAEAQQAEMEIQQAQQPQFGDQFGGGDQFGQQPGQGQPEQLNPADMDQGVKADSNDGKPQYPLNQVGNVFKESDHPRADDGKFGKGGGEDSSRDSERSMGSARPQDIRDGKTVLMNYTMTYPRSIIWGSSNPQSVYDRAVKTAGVELVKTDLLSVLEKPDERKVRKRASNNPIIVVELGGENGKHIVVDGNHRLDLAKEAGKKTINALVVKIPGRIVRGPNRVKRFIYVSNRQSISILNDDGRPQNPFGQEVSNVFCSTGEGGGVDPSCGEGSKEEDRGEGVKRSERGLSREWSYRRDPVDARFDYRTSRAEKNLHTAQEKDAAGIYTMEKYDEINNDLIAGKPFSEIVHGEEMQILATAASRLLPKPAIVYRGVSERVFKKVYLPLNKGAEIRAKGFKSTSFDPAIAVGFTNTSKKSQLLPAILEIKAKRGVGVMGESFADEEVELLQAPGTRYRYLSRSVKKISGKNVRVIAIEEI